MKRLAVVAVTVLFLMSSFAVFGAQPGVLSIWCDANRYQVLKPVAKQFEENYGVQVELTQVPFGDLRSKFRKAAPAGEGPDIVIGAHDWTGEFVSNGLIEPLIYAKQLKSNLVDVTERAFTYDGKMYALPYSYEAIALIYNKDLISPAPETWDQVVEFCEEFTNRSKQKYGFVYPGTGDPYHTYPFISAYGGYIFKYENGFHPDNLGLATEGALKGLRRLDKMYEKGYIPEGMNYGTATSLFRESKAAMLMTGPWEIPNVKNAGINFGVAPLPKMDGHQMQPFVGVQGFFISQFSENKVLANEFLKNYIASKDVMLDLYEKGGRPPAYIPALEEVKQDPVVAAFANSAAMGVPMPNIPAMSAVWANLGNKLQLISQQKQEPEAAMEDAVKVIKQALSE